MKNTKNTITTTNATTSTLINAAAVNSGQVNREPKVGDSVHFTFVTDGNGKRIKGGSEIPFDKITQIYEGTEIGKNGKPLFSVQVQSGDAVKITDTGKNAWEAVA